jgi:AraC-like DNA-binding protein
MAFNGKFLLNVAHLAARQGASIADFVSITNKTYEELNQDDCTVSNDTYNKAMEYAVKATKDDSFGLHMGENMNLSAAGLIIQITQTSQTVKQALELCCQYANLGCSVLPLQLFEENDCYKLTLNPNKLWQQQSEIAFKHTVDGVIAFTIKEFHSLSHMQHSPIAIHLTWPKPNNVAEYNRVFGCPVFFNKNEIAILLNKEQVEEKIITADYNLLKVLIAHANQKMAAIANNNSFVAVVKQSMLNLVKPALPTIEQVAAHLNISARTLQRRLSSENATYKNIIDGLRKDFALSYIKQNSLSITEISYLLNYNDASAFNRSFKRWTGKTPKAYRGN